MRLRAFISVLFISSALAGLSACNSSDAPTSQKVTPEMTAYASAAIDEFYDYDIDTLYARIDARIAGTISTADLETLADQAHETAMPAKKTKQGHSYSEERGIKIITLEYAIPNKIGGETATVSLSYDKNSCCQIVGFNLAKTAN